MLSVTSPARFRKFYISSALSLSVRVFNLRALLTKLSRAQQDAMGRALIFRKRASAHVWQHAKVSPLAANAVCQSHVQGDDDDGGGSAYGLS